jgi:superfamily I DNA/RNA helicase
LSRTEPYWKPLVDEQGEPVESSWINPAGFVVTKSPEGVLSLHAPGSLDAIAHDFARNEVDGIIQAYTQELADAQTLRAMTQDKGPKLSDFHPDTDEQAKLTNYQGSKLVVVAFAGTGKTTTLIKYAIKNPSLRILYIAYNKAIADESTEKFPSNVTCMTAHSLAYHGLGKEYREKLQNNLRLNDVIDLFQLDKFQEGVYELAGQIVTAINNFLGSVDEKPDVWHLPEFGQKISFSLLWKEKAKHQLHLVNEVWNNMRDLDSPFPITHDGYLKLYQLSKPNLALRFGAILLDEAQDTTPVVASLVMEQDLATILVGDPHQQIYRWRGADNALHSEYTKEADRLYLTNSFRFGPNVAMVANALLSYKGETNKVIGRGGKDEVLFGLPEDFKGQVCRLSRTVMGVVESAAHAAARGEKVYWVGGKNAYQIGDAMDVYHLSTGNQSQIKNKKLFGQFRSFKQYKDLAETTKDTEMNRAVRMVSTFGDNLPAILRRLSALTVEEPEEADTIVCTAHRSKGLEFETVILEEDYPFIFDQFYENKPELVDDEINLLYVAVTRALKRLVVNSVVEAVIRFRVATREKSIET